MVSKSSNRVNSFTDEFFNLLKTAVQKAKSEVDGPWYAAFDADGTLWNADMGELFFQYQIDHCGLELPEDPFRHYKDFRAQDAPAALAWLAGVNKGQSIEKVRSWSQDSFDTIKETLEIHPSMKDFIDFLWREDIQSYIVTASPKLAVEPAGAIFDIPKENVVGTMTEVHDGIISDVLDGVVTFKEGKIDGILKQTNGTKPLVCGGNTLADLPLLKTSSHVRLAVQSVGPTDRLFESEQTLRKTANENGWFSFSFY